MSDLAQGTEVKLSQPHLRAMSLSTYKRSTEAN